MAVGNEVVETSGEPLGAPVLPVGVDGGSHSGVHGARKVGVDEGQGLGIRREVGGLALNLGGGGACGWARRYRRGGFRGLTGCSNCRVHDGRAGTGTSGCSVARDGVMSE